MNRREFLKHSGRAAAATALLGIPACTPSSMAPSASSSPSPPSPSPNPSGRPTDAPAGPPTAADWATLASRVGGTVVLPGNTSYPVSARLFNPRFDTLLPAAVVYCASTADVQRAVEFARAHTLPITARSGGHSYAGYSSGAGMVCDVTRIAGVALRGDRSAVIGGGAHLIDAYAGLAAAGVAIPGGSCPTVGLAGLALGGGLGVLGRKFGLTCDRITGLDLVTAAGDAVHCDASTNADLFWACRGGGGGNFGIVTSMTFETDPVAAVTLFALEWPWPAAADVVAAWQQWITTLPDELWSNCHALSTTSPGPPKITVFGVLVGAQAQLTGSLSALRQAIGTAATSVFMRTYPYLDAMLVAAGCGGKSVASCHLSSQNPQGTVEREASLGKSDIVLQPWSSAAIATMLAGVTLRQANPAAATVAGVALDALGGAINRVAPDATAFVHRSGLFSVQYNATWPTGASADTVKSNVDGVNGLYASMRPYASGFAYQNYIDPELADWPNAYYGSNLARLKTVKARYDPSDLFHFAQGIPGH